MKRAHGNDILLKWIDNYIGCRYNYYIVERYNGSRAKKQEEKQWKRWR